MAAPRPCAAPEHDPESHFRVVPAIEAMVDMTPEDEWNSIRSRRAPLFCVAGMSMLRIALLFGSAAVALALILAPMADRYSKTQIVRGSGLDFMSTGSVGQGNSYTIRRSVLQAPGAVCIIDAAGRKSGDC